MVLSSFVIALSDISSPSIFLFLFPVNYFFSLEKRKPYYSRLFPDWVVRLQKVTENRFQFSICQKSIFPPKITFFKKHRKFDLLYYFFRFFKRLPSWGYYGDDIFFLRRARFCLKQRIRCCLWKRANRSHF